MLADLYAIGVIGAIAINLGSTSTNRAVPLKTWERSLMLVMTVLLTAIELTICVVKPHARGFAIVMLVIGLSGRLITIVANPVVPIPHRGRIAYMTFAATAIAVVLGLESTVGDTWLGFAMSASVALLVGYASLQTQGHRAAIIAAETAEAPADAPARMLVPGAYKPTERVMVATQGNPRLLAYALKQCKSREAELQLLFLRPLAVTPMGASPASTLAEDPDARDLFEQIRAQAHEAGVPLRLLYGATTDIPYAILDMAVTHGADTLMLGATRRGTLWRAMKGDVISGVAEQLPEGIDLLVHA
jgi:nucleotide-binding universal stress UspA family protein